MDFARRAHCAGILVLFALLFLAPVAGQASPRAVTLVSEFPALWNGIVRGAHSINGISAFHAEHAAYRTIDRIPGVLDRYEAGKIENLPAYGVRMGRNEALKVLERIEPHIVANLPDVAIQHILDLEPPTDLPADIDNTKQANARRTINGLLALQTLRGFVVASDVEADRAVLAVLEEVSETQRSISAVLKERGTPSSTHYNNLRNLGDRLRTHIEAKKDSGESLTEDERKTLVLFERVAFHAFSDAVAEGAQLRPDGTLA